MVKQLRKVNAENRRLKQIVGELRLSTNQSEMSELKQLNCSSRFMLSQRKEVELSALKRGRTQNCSSVKLQETEQMLPRRSNDRNECELSDWQDQHKNNSSSFIKIKPTEPDKQILEYQEYSR